jgi:hypothetical protein
VRMLKEYLQCWWSKCDNVKTLLVMLLFVMKFIAFSYTIYCSRWWKKQSNKLGMVSCVEDTEVPKAVCISHSME